MVDVGSNLAGSGTGAAWGDNSKGELANGQLGNRPVSDWSNPGLFTISNTLGSAQIVGGGYHFLSLLAGGKAIMAWGSNFYGQIGNNVTNHVRLDAPAPMTVLDSAGRPFAGSGGAVSAVAAGYGFSLALAADGTVWGWGDNKWGELAQGPTDTNHIHVQPVQVTVGPNAVLGKPGVSPPITMIAAGAFDAFAVDANGAVWAWGKNDTNQLGVATPAPTYPTCPGTVQCSHVAVKVGNVCGSGTPQQVAAGTQHTLVLCRSSTSPPSLVGWGANQAGQLDAGSDPCATLKLGNLSQVVAGGYHNLAVCVSSSAATVIGWGANNDGQVGSGNAALKSPPAIVMRAGGVPLATTDVAGATHIAAGYQHSLALLPGGTVYAWGSNSAGQLGQPPATVTSSDLALPVTLTGIIPSEIAAGSNTSAVTN
jgi:alpha-tubulin suppressor-like RCC1 family protein